MNKRFPWRAAIHKPSPTKQVIVLVSLDDIPDEAVEEADPYAVMWAKVQIIADTLDVSEEEAQRILLGRIKQAAE